MLTISSYWTQDLDMKKQNRYPADQWKKKHVLSWITI